MTAWLPRYSSDENLRIFIGQEENFGNLKTFGFPGDFLTAGIVFPPLALWKNAGAPYTPPPPVTMAVLTA
jgi:hypothetical protein